MKNAQKTIFITGGNSGIGASLAAHYADFGVTLLLTGRNTDRLKAVAAQCKAKGATVKTATIDVTDKAVMTQQIITWDEEHPIDLVIANAGISFKGAESTETLTEVFDINLNGTLNTIEPLIPRMQKRRRGQIAVMSSLAAFRGMPTARAYSASKAAVRFYGEALRPRLAQDNIGVTVICPGFVETPLTDQNDFKMPFIMSADRAADIIAHGLDKNKGRVAFPLIPYFSARCLEILPNFITDRLLLNPPQRSDP